MKMKIYFFTNTFCSFAVENNYFGSKTVKIGVKFKICNNQMLRSFVLFKHVTACSFTVYTVHLPNIFYKRDWTSPNLFFLYFGCIFLIKSVANCPIACYMATLHWGLVEGGSYLQLYHLICSIYIKD